VAQIVSVTDYYAFGMEIKERSWSVSSYRYGFNTQEQDREIFEGSYTAEYWQYDSRLGRRWNVDPVNKPWESSYACFRNKPILLTDINGDDVDLDNLSEKDREKVLSYTDKESKNYNEEFANLYNLLDSDKNTVYQFNNTNIDASNPYVKKAFGHVGYEGKNESGQDIISINYTMNLSGIWAKETALFEETFHADQFRRGEFGFSQQDDGTWNTVGLEIYDEIEAKVWTHSNVNNGKPLGQNLNEYKKYKRNKEEYKAYLLKNPTYKYIHKIQEDFIKALSRETKYSEEDIKSWFDEKGVIMSNNKAGRMPTN
jgi:hypothetical protein